MMKFTPVAGSKSLLEAFIAIPALVDKAKSNEAPTSPIEALKWVNDSPTLEARQARKVLSFAAIYGAGPKTFKQLKSKT